MSADALREFLSAAALEAGFTRVGFARPDALSSQAARLDEWLREGRHAGMGYLERSPRHDPALLLEGARALMVVTAAYEALDRPIASYALCEDYHRKIRDRLDGILKRAQSRFEGLRGVVCVDTKPLLERAAAAAAGLGWIGKNTMLLDERTGPWTLLGVLVLDRDVAPDSPVTDRCGVCTRCLDACPTDAFPRSYALDARRCLSYWTIEHRGPLPEAFREAQGQRIFGCDDCLTACPFGPPSEASSVLPVAGDLTDLTPESVLERLERGFNRSFKKHALSRAGKAGLTRNALAALGNRGRDPAAASIVARYLDHPDRGVRIHAAWALGRTGAAADRAILRDARDAESDAEVREAMSAALEELEGCGQAP